MSTITLNKEKLISAIFGVICGLFIIIGSAEKTAVYFVIAIVCLLIAIGIHFVTKQCLKKVFQVKKETPPEKPTVNTGGTSDPSNTKPTIVKLEELQIKI